MNAPTGIVKKTDDSLIYVIRGQKVMLDEDLARIYGVTTKRLNEQVKRNITRFPADFMFQLTEEEYSSLKMQPFLTDADQAGTTSEKDLGSQIATSKKAGASKGTKTNLKSQNATSSSRHGGRRFMPYAFTEHGTVMLASVLNSPKAVHASIQVVKAFVRLRELMLASKDLAKKLDSMEEKYDKQFAVVFDAVRRLMDPPVTEPETPRKRIGYKRKNDPKDQA